MMRRFSQLVGAVLMCLSVPSSAQHEVVDELPPEYTAKGPDSWLDSDGKAWLTDERKKSPLWRERVVDRHGANLALGRYHLVLREMCAEFEATIAAQDTGYSVAYLARMKKVSDAFLEVVQEAGLSEGVETVEDRSRVSELLKARSIGTRSLLPEWKLTEDDITNLLSVAGKPTAKLAGKKYELLVPREELQRIRLIEDALRMVLGDFIEPLLGAQLESLRKAERQWNAYLFEGYSQYPWESLFNGWAIDFDTFEPPEHQWILAHPSIAFEASTLSLDEIQADEVLAVELLGHLWYYDENLEYWGFSLTTTLHDELSPGLGLLAHWSNKISLGVTWHDLDDDDHYFDEDPFVLLSVDLFGYVQTQGPAFKEKYDVVRGLLGR